MRPTTDPEWMTKLDAKVQGSRCNPKIMEKGTQVFMGHLPTLEMELWVGAIRGMSDQKVDWCFQGGRAFVMALGDIERVKWSIEKLMPTYRALGGAGHGT